MGLTSWVLSPVRTLAVWTSFNKGVKTKQIKQTKCCFRTFLYLLSCFYTLFLAMACTPWCVNGKITPGVAYQLLCAENTLSPTLKRICQVLLPSNDSFSASSASLTGKAHVNASSKPRTNMKKVVFILKTFQLLHWWSWCIAFSHLLYALFMLILIVSDMPLLHFNISSLESILIALLRNNSLFQ